jgi:cellulose binding protein with CBM3 domain
MFRKALQDASTRRRALMGASLLAGLLAGSMAFAQSVSNLSALDRSHDNDNPDNQLYFHLQVANGGTVAAPLSAITVRYWFTNETPSDPLRFECDYAQVSCSNVTSKLVALTTPLPKANMYLEIGFTAAAGSIAPNGSTGEIQTRIHHVAYSNFNTTESYSFISDPSFVYKPSTTVTVYLNGVLVWGQEPH